MYSKIEETSGEMRQNRKWYCGFCNRVVGAWLIRGEQEPIAPVHIMLWVWEEPITSPERMPSMIDTFLAHFRQSDKVAQPLMTHLRETSELAAAFAAKISLEDHGRITGLLHDLGCG